jgi:dihydrofolate reductase
MRTVTYGAACSLDGFITGPHGSMDWLHFSEDVSRVMGAYWPTVDTILMGRRTWEVALSAQDGGEAGDQGTSGLHTFVFSRTLRQVSQPGATLVREDAGAFVRALKRKPGKGICLMGGGELAQALIAAGLVDEIGLNIHPVILGSGTPFLRDPGMRIALELTESRVMDGGCVLARYRVRRMG